MRSGCCLRTRASGRLFEDCEVDINSDSSHRRPAVSGSAQTSTPVNCDPVSSPARFNACCPSFVFGSWTTGTTDSASKGKPPLPDFLSVVSIPSRCLNESTATMMNAADAISAIHNTLLPGREVAFLNPSRATDHHPKLTIGFRVVRRNDAAW